MSDERSPSPQIIESFHGYTPSFDVRKLIERMLAEVPPKLLGSLHAIVLTNVAALSRQDRKRRGLSRTPLEQSRGYYTQAWKGEPARITILLDNIEEGWSGWWWRIGFIRAMAISEVFFHELGHHIHRVHRPKYEDRENVADKYSRKLSSRFLLGRYWYFVPLFALVALIGSLGKDAIKLGRRLRAKWEQR